MTVNRTLDGVGRLPAHDSVGRIRIAHGQRSTAPAAAEAEVITPVDPDPTPRQFPPLYPLATYCPISPAKLWPDA